MSERDDPGPGGICDDCGHFAGRHYDGACDTGNLYSAGTPRRPCRCAGFLWLGQRYASGRDIYDGVPPLAASVNESQQ